MIILFLLFAQVYACTDRLKIVCEAVCAQDGDEKGIVIGPYCYCANKRDLNKILTKVNSNFRLKTLIDEKKTHYYDQE